MNNDTTGAIIKAISEMVARTPGHDYPQSLCHYRERIFFEAFLSVTKARGLTHDEVLQAMDRYCQYAGWHGVLVRDSSPFNGNGGRGDTWALIRGRGMLVSFGGAPFQEFYEPVYDQHDRDDCDDDAIDYDPVCLEGIMDRKTLARPPVAPDVLHDFYVNSIRSVMADDYDEDDDILGSSFSLVPGFNNPLMLEAFASGRTGQDVIRVTPSLLRKYRAADTSEWVKQRRDSSVTGCGFDILSTAALRHHAGKPVARELRSWNEEQFLQVRDACLTMAEVWPHDLSGTLTFVSEYSRSWIAIEQKTGEPRISKKEHEQLRDAYGKILALLTGMKIFCGRSHGQQVHADGTVTFDPEGQAIVRTIASDFRPGAYSDARTRLIYMIAGHGFDPEAIRSCLDDPIALVKTIDPRGWFFVSKVRNAFPMYFGSASFLPSRRKPAAGNSASLVGRSGQQSRGGRLYQDLGGQGDDKVYLSDGLWLSSDGGISDDGR